MSMSRALGRNGYEFCFFVSCRVPFTDRIVGADEGYLGCKLRKRKKTHRAMQKLKQLTIKRFVKRFFINDFLLLGGRIVHIFLL